MDIMIIQHNSVDTVNLCQYDLRPTCLDSSSLTGVLRKKLDEKFKNTQNSPASDSSFTSANSSFSNTSFTSFR